MESLERRFLFAVDMGFQPAAEASAAEQLVIELINRARANPAAEAARYGIDLNKDLTSPISPAPKQPLAINSSLNRASELHSRDMLANDYFDHIGKNGSTPSKRATDAGYSNGAGENIAVRSVATVNPQSDAEVAHEQLFRSAGHRSNLLTDFYREIGVGIEYGDYAFQSIGDLPAMMTTEKFGASNKHFITGVVFSDGVINDDFYSVAEGIGKVSIVATDTTGNKFSTETGAAGGYALHAPNGNYSLVAIIPGRQSAVNLGTVTIQNANTKVDIATDKLPSDLLPPPVENPTSDPIVDPVPQPVADSKDVNGDGHITALDALRVINAISRGSRTELPQYDVNGDGNTTPLDALLIINHISRTKKNSIAAGEAANHFGPSHHAQDFGNSTSVSNADDRKRDAALLGLLI